MQVAWRGHRWGQEEERTGLRSKGVGVGVREGPGRGSDGRGLDRGALAFSGEQSYSLGKPQTGV